MSVIGSEQLKASLDAAKNLGLAEESFTIEGIDVTLRNLRPEESLLVLQACEGLSDIDYLHTYQREHLAHSIVEINGADLRGVDFIEDETSDAEGNTKTVKVERHAFLRDHVVSTWGKEAIFVAYRKYLDVVQAAEEKAQNGIDFWVEDETPEEKYRRLLLEMRDLEDELPDTLLDHVLGEQGLIRRSTAEAAKSAMEKLDQMDREQAVGASEPSKVAPAPPVEKPPASPPEPDEPPLAQQIKAAPRQDREVVVDRAPPSQQPATETPRKFGERPDPHSTLQQAIDARRQQPIQQQAQEDPQPPTRADKIAALESLDHPVGSAKTPTGSTLLPGKDGKMIPVHQPPGQEIEGPVELRKQTTDHAALVENLDQPPKAGINPRFKPPTKL